MLVYLHLKRERVMTKLTHILMMAVMVVCLSGCEWDDPFLYKNQDNLVTVNPSSPTISTNIRSITVLAETKEPDSSVTPEEQISVRWQTGDEICVYSVGGEENEELPINYLKLTDGAESMEGVFTCDSKMEFTKSKSIYVMYPSSMHKEGDATPIWPEEQVFYPSHPERIEVPMFADARMSNDRSYVSDVNMNIIGGMLKLVVNNNRWEVGLTRIEFSTDKPMAGHISLNNNSGYYKAIIHSDSLMANRSILHCASRIKLAQGQHRTFRLNLPENSYNGITVALYDRDELVAKMWYDSKLYIDRAKVTTRELTIE